MSQFPTPDVPQQQQRYPTTTSPAYYPPQPMNEKATDAPIQPQPQYHEHKHDAQTSQPSKWAFGLFDCFAPLPMCCIGFWCPCYLFGKTHERNKTGEKDPSGLNGMCFAYCALGYCGFASCLQCITRGSTRDKYNIDGNMGVDFATALCCNCCALVQEEKESIVRQTGMDPVSGAVYRPVVGMEYA